MKSGKFSTLFSSFLLLKMNGCAPYVQIMRRVINFGEQKVLNKMNILTTNSLHMKNQKNTQRQSWNVQKWHTFSAKKKFTNLPRSGDTKPESKTKEQTYNNEIPQTIFLAHRFWCYRIFKWFRNREISGLFNIDFINWFGTQSISIAWITNLH